MVGIDNVKILKNYFYNAAYQIFTLIVPLITIPYISRVLGPQGVGINTLTNSTIQYFVLLANLGLTTYGQRQIAYKRKNMSSASKEFWGIETLSIVTTAFSLLCFIGLMFFIDKYRTYYFAQAFLILASAFDVSWFFMGLENFKITVLRNFIFKILSVAMIFLFVKNDNDLIVYILIISVLTVFSNLSLWPYLKKYLVNIKLKDIQIKKHLIPAFQLFIPQIAISVYSILNKVMLGHLDTVESSGYFDNSDKIIRICLTLLTAFSTVMMPHIASSFINGEQRKIRRYINQGMKIALLFSIPLAVGIVCVSPDFVPVFFGNKFLPVVNVMSIEAIAVVPIACASILGAQYLVPVNKNNKYTISILGGALVNIVINIPLIKFFSASGAAAATVISEVVVTLIQVKYTQKDLDIRPSFSEVYKIIISCIPMGLFIKIISGMTTPSLFAIAIEGVGGIFIYLVMLLLLRVDSVMDVMSMLKQRR